MKLVLAVVRDSDAERMVNRLVEGGFRVTRIASSGGFLRRGSATLVSGVEDEQVQNVIQILKEACGPAESGQHRVTLFVIRADRFIQLQ